MTDSGVEKALTENKIAGIPPWGIGVGLAGLLIIWLYIHQRKNPPVTPTAEGTMPDPNALVTEQGDTGLPTGPIGDWLGQNPTSSAFPVGLTGRGVPGPITNQQWARLAFDELTAKGDDPTLVENALAKFLSGQPLSTAEEAVKNLAEQLFGAPPEGVMPVTVSPGPTPTPTPTGDGKPPAVTNLHKTGVSPSSVSLAWDPSPGATSYHVVERSPYGGTPHDVSSPSFSVEGLRAPDTNHVFTVYAVNSSGTSAGTSIIVHTTGHFVGPRPTPVNPDVPAF